MKTPGEILKRAREEHGWSVKEAAIATCISKIHIQHLENNRFDEFQEVFARGFIRNYARELGCDPYSVIRAFDRMRAEEATYIAQEKTVSYEPQMLKKTHFQIALAIVFLLSVIVAVGLVASSRAVAEDPASFEKPKSENLEIGEEMRKTRWLLEQPENDPDRLLR